MLHRADYEGLGPAQAQALYELTEQIEGAIALGMSPAEVVEVWGRILVRLARLDLDAVLKWAETHWQIALYPEAVGLNTQKERGSHE